MSGCIVLTNTSVYYCHVVNTYATNISDKDVLQGRLSAERRNKK